jgi:hypothetical protein
MTTLRLIKSIGRSPLRRAFHLVPLVLVCFALSPTAQAQLSPPPDGGYPGFNTAEGDDALFNLTSGIENSAIGFNALFRNTTGSHNTATGFQALSNNVGGLGNTANGRFALFSNINGSSNTAVGSDALLRSRFPNGNTAIGASALFSDTSGQVNTATGASALFSNTTGNNNTATGYQALLNNQTGNNNTANGFQALSSNQTGVGNTAYGVRALFNNTTGSRNIALGIGAGSSLTTGDSNIDIGHTGFANDAATIRIGSGNQTRTFIAGIRGRTTGANSIPVLIDAAGQLGTVASSQRFKNDIIPMDKASEAILGLKPVTFHYKSDTAGTPQFGLIAEEVAKVNPDLVVRDENGEIYTVRYDAVNAMLLNEFLKEHCRVEELEANDAQQQKEIKALTAELKEQASQIQKVSAQIEMSKPAPQTVLNNR